MKTKEELDAIKANVRAMNEKLSALTEDELKEVSGGMASMANPVSGMSEEEARRIAEELGEGKDMGSWKTMSKEQFLKWWESSNRRPG